MLQLIRISTIKKNEEDICLIGWLYVYKGTDTIARFASLELPWRNNNDNISCIPPGPGEEVTYNLKLLQSSNSFDYPHYLIQNVKDRDYCKIHAGNFYDQIRGCILIGENHIDIDYDDVVDVTNSRKSLKKLIKLAGPTPTLSIKNLA